MLAISQEEDLKRFAVLDRLIMAGYSSTNAAQIPAEVIEAAEKGWAIPIKGHDRDKALARTGPTPDEVILERRRVAAAAVRMKYDPAKARERKQRMKLRAAGPAGTGITREGNLEECRL